MQAVLQVLCAFRGKSDVYSFSRGNIYMLFKKKYVSNCSLPN